MINVFFGSGGPVSNTTGARVLCDAPTGADVLVQPISVSQWRVVDRRFPESDACSLLGFIEEKNQLFEVMLLREGFQWFTLPSLAEALDRFSQPTAGTAREQLEFSL